MKVGKKKQNPSWLPSGSYDKDSGNLEFFKNSKSGDYGSFFSMKNTLSRSKSYFSGRNLAKIRQ